MPRLIIDQPTFRVVETILPGNQAVYVLEVPEDPDAMGNPKWRKFNTSGKDMKAIFEFLISLGLTHLQESDSAQH